MKRSSLQRYQNRKALYLYGLIDLLVPPAILSIFHFIFTSEAWSKPYYSLAALSSILFITTTAIQGGYSRYHERTISKKLEITFKTWFCNLFAMLVITYTFSATLKFSQEIMLFWALFTPICVVSLKIIVNYFSMKTSRNQINIATLGRNYNFNEHEMEMLKSQSINLTYVTEKDIESISPDYILLNLEQPASKELIKHLTHLNVDGLRIIELHHFMEVFLRKCYIPYDKENLSYLDNVHKYNTANYFLKRLVDWCAVIVLGVITNPLIIWASFRIRKESPGPIIFSQPRISIKSKEKTIYKFRSMHLDAEEDGAQFATLDDPRAYEFGAFMRKTRIDELPQLWNVAKGDLHFIGPRPERKVFTTQLEEKIPYYHERHLVRPGISGWAQVLYPYGANTEDSRQKLMYDLYYIKHWSIWLEMETLIRTIGVVLGKKGL